MRLLNKTILFFHFFFLGFILLTSINSFSQKPEAGFYSNVTEGCAPLQVSFFDTSTNTPTSWKWDFGDGGANAFIQNPKRTYDLPGTYSIQLIATNSDGGDTVTYTSYIKVYGKPTAGFTATPPSGCAPLTVQFADSSISGSGVIVKWEWFMGDGETDTIQNPQHIYTGNKTYQVTLIITDEYGCKDSEVKKIATYKPAAIFSASKTSICKDTLTVNFTNTSTGDAPLSYLWDFGDGNTSIDKSPKYFYSGYGNYIVSLKVTNANLCVDNTSTTISLIDFQPDFEANDMVFCLGETITFTDLTANSGTKTWFWGDTKKNTTSAKTITKTYTDAGTYTVQMTVNSIGNACNETVTKTNYITVLPLPEPKISVDDSIPCQKGTTLNFSAGLSALDSIMWIIWNEPDTDKVNNIVLSTPVNDTLFGNDTSFQVMVEDSFHVMLYVKGQNGCNITLTQNDFIILKEPDAYITAAPSVKGCIPLEVFFFGNNSIAYFGDSIISYDWKFIDPYATEDTTASGTPASYTWDSAGVFYAKMVIKTMRGCTSLNYQNVYPGKKPVANMKLPAFTVDGAGVDDTSLCYGSSIWFRDSSKGLIDEWFWSIHYLADSSDDKKGSTEGKETEYFFKDTLGYFDIVHIVGYNECYDTIIYTAITDTTIDMATMPDSVIRINIMGPIPGFRGDSLLYHADTLISLQDTLYIGKDTIYITSDIEITVADTTFIPSVFDTFIVNNDTILIPIAWDFVINKQDTFIVKSGTVYNLADTIIVNEEIVYFPADTFSVADQLSEIAICPDTITVKFQTEDVLADNIAWYFEYPDEFVSGHPDSVIKGNPKTFGTYGSPFHIYNGPGFFSVRQHVFNGKTNCDDEKFSEDLIKISALKSIFEIDTVVFCKSQPLNLEDSSITNFDLDSLEDNFINRIEWDFDDGTTLVYDRSTLIYPPDILSTMIQIYFDSVRTAPFTHFFQKTGKLKITHFVYDDLGCVDSTSEYVVVKGTDINFVADTLIGCEPFTVNFADSSTGTDSVYNWIWDFGDGNASINPFPKHIYKNSGDYSVSLSTINLDLCSDTLIKPVYIKCIKPNPTFTIADNVKCNNESFSFDAKNTTGERLKYIWEFGDSSYAIANSKTAAHAYQNPEDISDSTYTVKLITIDSVYRCFDSYEKTLIVESPIAGFTTDATEGCLPFPVQFFDTSQTRSSAVYWAWQVADSITFEGTGAGQQYPTNVYSSPGIYDVSLLIVNAEGCSSSVKIDSFIIVKGANIEYSLSPIIGCLPLTVAFSYKLDNTSSIDSILFADGGDTVINVSAFSAFTYTYHTPQTFSPIITVYDGGCKNSFPLGKISADTLISSFQTDSLVHCNLEEYVFKDLSENKHPGSYINSLKWDFGDGTTSTDSTVTNSYSKEGIYTLIQTVTSSYGCIASDTTILYVFNLPNIDLSISESAACIPFTVNFDVNLTDSLYGLFPAYYWDFGNGAIDSNNTTSHLYEQGGIYEPIFYYSLYDTIIYHINDTTFNAIDTTKVDTIITRDSVDVVYVCNSAKKSNSLITMYQIPLAGFIMDTTVQGTLHPLVQFYDSSFTDPNVLHEWLWNFGDPASGNDNTTNELDPSHKYSSPGYYEVMLIVSNYGCADTFILVIPAYNNEKFDPPNIITPPPNTPGLNDVFFIPGLPENSKLIIYNRWGQEIFKSADSGYLNNWDGGNMPSDTYYYILTNAQTGLEYNGFIRLSR